MIARLRALRALGAASPAHGHEREGSLRALPRGKPPHRRDERGACCAVAPEGREGERKVRTPQGSAPGNARSGQLEGKWHRKYTAHRRPQGRRWVRVKRCGKSAPRPWQHGWQAKPRTEQGQIGNRYQNGPFEASG